MRRVMVTAKMRPANRGEPGGFCQRYFSPAGGGGGVFSGSVFSFQTAWRGAEGEGGAPRRDGAARNGGA